MSDLPQQQGKFNPGTARESLRFLRKKASGSLLITSGLKDVRLVVSSRSVTVEAEGTIIYGEEQRDLVRTVLCTLFWEEPSFFLDPDGTTGTTASSTITVAGSQYEILNTMDRGISELMPIHQRVPGVDLLVTVGGEPPPEEIRSHTANLFRILSRTPNGGHLAIAAQQAGLDVIDAAWSVSDLMDASQASIRRPPAPMKLRRLAHAEGLAEYGLLPAVRFVHLARAFTRNDPIRAARHYQEAAAAFLLGGQAEHAMMAYRSCLELDADNVAALEGLASSLEELGRAAEGKRIRERLIGLYLRWAMPSRARQQLEKIPQPTAEQRELQLNTMLLTGDYAAATALSKRLLPSLDSGSVLALAKRFAKAGARGKDLEQIVKLCGLHSLSGAKRAVNMLSALAALLVLLLGAEVVLRARFLAASEATKPKLAAADFAGARAEWDGLYSLDTTAGASSRKLPVTCLTRVGEVVDGLRLLEADVAGLKADGEAHALLKFWADPKDIHLRDVPADLGRLERLPAESPQLKALVQAAIGRIMAYRKEGEEKVKTYKGLAQRLPEAKELIERYSCVRKFGEKEDLFLDQGTPLTLAVKVNVFPKEAELFWKVGDGVQKRFKDPRPNPGSSADAWLVRLPLTTASAGMTIYARRKGHVEQSLDLAIMDLETPAVDLRLISNRQLRKAYKKPLLMSGVHWVDKKDGGQYDGDIRRATRSDVVPAFPDPKQESAKFARLLAADPVLAELLKPSDLVIIQAHNKAFEFGPYVHVTRIVIWFEDPNRGEAKPRSLENLGVGRHGMERPLIKGADNTWSVAPLDQARKPERFQRTREAIVETVKLMVKEVR